MFQAIEFCIRCLAGRTSPVTGKVAPCDTETAAAASDEVVYLKNILESWKVEEAEWKGENDRLRKALEFYAPAARYDKKDGWLELDGGATARAALNPE